MAAATPSIATPTASIAAAYKHRRVSYVLPNAVQPLPLLSLPALDVNRRGRIDPVYSVKESVTQRATTAPAGQAHLKHRLPVQALALDFSTAIDGHSSDEAGHPAPAGILYTGGRDGLICSWELSLPTRKRKRRYGAELEDGGSDSDDPDNDDDDQAASDADLVADLDLGTASSSKPVSKRATSSSSRPRKDSSASFRRTRVRDSGDVLPIEDRWEIDLEKVRDDAPPPTSYRQGIQSHTDWVNDIALVNRGRTLVSVSSDSLVLAWNPHSSSHEEQVTPHRLGSHADYIRCLAASRDAGWVASGGFDRKIKIWDVWEGRSTAALELPSPPASIYSLAATHSGNLLACGSPERIIRVYDPRSRQQVSRLNGHTDNVRSVLLSEDGQWLLSASSDSTVKLWSIAAQKCLHTFSHHSSSVWSLHSQHPNLEIFYSGDKAGNIAKIDLVGTGDPEEGECILLARDSMDDNEPGDIPRGCEGVTKLVARDDAYVWAASGSSSVKRWRDVPPRSLRSASLRPKIEIIDNSSTNLPMDSSEQLQPSQSLPEGGERDFKVGSPSVSFLENLTTTLSRTASGPSPRVSAVAGTQSVHRPSSLKMRPTVPRPFNAQKNSSSTVILPAAVTAGTALFDIPYESLVPLTLPDDNFFSPLFASRAKDPEIATIYSSVSAFSGSYSAAHRANMSTSPMSKRPTSLAETVHSEAQPVSMARRDFLERDSITDCTPLRTAPDLAIRGEHGLTRCEMLSDRRHVLTIDTDDQVALWDILYCRCLGVFEDMSPDARRPSDALSSLSGNGSTGSADTSSSDLLEYVRDRIDGEGAIAPWCKCDARVGALTVHVDETRAWEGEVYADELGFDDYPPDFRFTLGKMVLKNLFNGFIDGALTRRGGAEVSASPDSRPSLRLSLTGLSSSSVPPSPSSRMAGMTIGLATPALNRAVLPDADQPKSPRPALWDLTPIPQSPGTPRFQESAAPGSPSATPATGGSKTDQDYFSLPTVSSPPAQKPPEATSPVPPTPGGTLRGRLKFLGKSKRQENLSALPPIATVSSDTNTNVVQEKEKTPLEVLLAKPITPCPPQEAPPIQYPGEMAIMFAEETGDGSAWAVTYRGLAGTLKDDVDVIQRLAPLWLLDFLLGNRVQLRDPVKVAFVLQPWHDIESAGLPELPNANARLNANRNLRVRKVMAYVAEKLDLQTTSRAPSISSASVAGGGGAASQPQSPTNGTPANRVNGMVPLSSNAANDGQPEAPKRERSQSNATTQSSIVGLDPEQDLEILCGEQLLTPRMTLAAIRNYYWKSGGDVVLAYRRKRHTS